MQVTLKALRTNYGLTQTGAAKLVGVSADTWHNYETCKTYPNAEKVDKITKAFGITYDDLIFLPYVTIKS